MGQGLFTAAYKINRCVQNLFRSNMTVLDEVKELKERLEDLVLQARFKWCFNGKDEGSDQNPEASFRCLSNKKRQTIKGHSTQSPGYNI